MKFSAAIPLGVIAPSEFQSKYAIAQMGACLERAGIDACYVTDHPAPSSEWLHTIGHDALDPFTALAFVAAATEHLHLHTNIVVLPYRNPFITAKAAATLQVLSGGRLILGLGAGYQAMEFEALGIDVHERGALFDEGLEILRLAWAGGPVQYEGRHFRAAGNEPRPAPAVPPAIWIGGNSTKALERAARLGDGWSPFFANPAGSSYNKTHGIQSIAHLRDCIDQIGEKRAALGRTGAFDICIGPHASLKQRSRAQADAYLEAVDDVARHGVSWVTVEPGRADRSDFMECVQWFGEEVISRLRASQPLAMVRRDAL